MNLERPYTMLTTWQEPPLCQGCRDGAACIKEKLFKETTAAGYRASSYHIKRTVKKAYCPVFKPCQCTMSESDRERFLCERFKRQSRYWDESNCPIVQSRQDHINKLESRRRKQGHSASLKRKVRDCDPRALD